MEAQFRLNNCIATEPPRNNRSRRRHPPRQSAYQALFSRPNAVVRPPGRTPTAAFDAIIGRCGYSRHARPPPPLGPLARSTQPAGPTTMLRDWLTLSADQAIEHFGAPAEHRQGGIRAEVGRRKGERAADRVFTVIRRYTGALSGVFRGVQGGITRHGRPTSPIADSGEITLAVIRPTTG